MKSVVLIVLLALLVVSFGFLDGWPFRSSKPQPPVSSEVPLEKGLTEGQSAPANAAAKPSEQDQPSSSSQARPEASESTVMALREAMVEARNFTLERRLRAMSEIVLRFELPLEYRMEVLGELRELSRQQVQRGAKGLAAERIAVASGDNLTRIAHRVQKSHGGNVSPAMVMKLNGLSSDRIRVGQQLMVPTGSLEVVISKADHRLYLLLDGVVVIDYPIGIGRDDSTPEGSFAIVNKTVNPTWRTPDGRLLPYGHPEHIIGNRWLGFAGEGGPTSYGIHGTVEPESIGKNESDGCVRMLEADVEEIFRLVPEGCPVRLLP